MSLVVHWRRSEYDVLIDRTTSWGNPYRIGRDGTREEVIAKFRAWWYLPSQKSLRQRARKELKGKRLGCWCAPRACHGHVIVQYVNRIRVDMTGIPSRKYGGQGKLYWSRCGNLKEYDELVEYEEAQLHAPDGDPWGTEWVNQEK